MRCTAQSNHREGLEGEWRGNTKRLASEREEEALGGRLNGLKPTDACGAQSNEKPGTVGLGAGARENVPFKMILKGRDKKDPREADG